MRADDWPTKAVAHERREITRVIEMGVRENDRVDLVRCNRELGPIALAQQLEALEQTAIDENPMAACVDQMLRSGDGAGGAEELERDRHCNPFRGSMPAGVSGAFSTFCPQRGRATGVCSPFQQQTGFE